MRKHLTAGPANGRAGTDRLGTVPTAHGDDIFVFGIELDHFGSPRMGLALSGPFHSAPASSASTR